MTSLKDNTGALYRSQTDNHITIKGPNFIYGLKSFWHWTMPSLLPFMVSVVLNKNSKWSLLMTNIFFVCLFAWHKNSVDFHHQSKGMYKDYYFDTDKAALYQCRKYAHILLHVCLSNQFFLFYLCFQKTKALKLSVSSRYTTM